MCLDCVFCLCTVLRFLDATIPTRRDVGLLPGAARSRFFHSPFLKPPSFSFSRVRTIIPFPIRLLAPVRLISVL